MSAASMPPASRNTSAVKRYRLAMILWSTVASRPNSDGGVSQSRVRCSTVVATGYLGLVGVRRCEGKLYALQKNTEAGFAGSARSYGVRTRIGTWRRRHEKRRRATAASMGEFQNMNASTEHRAA